MGISPQSRARATFGEASKLRFRTFPTSQKGRVPRPTANPITDELRFLEELFTPDGLAGLSTNSPSHPAVQRYETLRSVLWGDAQSRSSRFDWRDRPQIVGQLVAAMADRAPWLNSRAGPLDLLSSKTIVELRRRLADQSQFADTFSELLIKAILEARGIPTAFAQGRPDLELSLSSDSVVPLEVKHLHQGSGVARISKVIRKVNVQIRDGHSALSGMMLIRVERDLSEPTGVEDSTPDEVRIVVDEVNRVFSGGRHRSVAAATIMWDELFEVERRTDRAILTFLRRRAEFVEHPAPRATLALGDEFAKHFGWTAMVSALSSSARL